MYFVLELSTWCPFTRRDDLKMGAMGVFFPKHDETVSVNRTRAARLCFDM